MPEQPYDTLGILCLIEAMIEPWEAVALARALDAKVITLQDIETKLGQSLRQALALARSRADAHA